MSVVLQSVIVVLVIPGHTHLLLDERNVLLPELEEDLF